MISLLNIQPRVLFQHRESSGDLDTGSTRYCRILNIPQPPLSVALSIPSHHDMQTAHTHFQTPAPRGQCISTGGIHLLRDLQCICLWMFVVALSNSKQSETLSVVCINSGIKMEQYTQLYNFQQLK